VNMDLWVGANGVKAMSVFRTHALASTSTCTSFFTMHSMLSGQSPVPCCEAPHDVLQRLLVHVDCHAATAVAAVLHKPARCALC
jgi:hypothetical protein